MFSFLASGIKKHYEIGETLGQCVHIVPISKLFRYFPLLRELIFMLWFRGSFAVVKMGIPKNGSEHVAIKIVDKKVSPLDAFRNFLADDFNCELGRTIRCCVNGAGGCYHEKSKSSELYQAS
jgi:hypothetical protein